MRNWRRVLSQNQNLVPMKRCTGDGWQQRDDVEHSDAGSGKALIKPEANNSIAARLPIRPNRAQKKRQQNCPYRRGEILRPPTKRK